MCLYLGEELFAKVETKLLIEWAKSLRGRGVVKGRDAGGMGQETALRPEGL